MGAWHEDGRGQLGVCPSGDIETERNGTMSGGFQMGQDDNKAHAVKKMNDFSLWLIGRKNDDLKVVLTNQRYSLMAWPTIMCKQPRKRAEMPPVPVLMMKSKTSQGRSGAEGALGMLDALVCWSCLMNSQSMRSKEKPQKPLPLSVRI